MIQPSIRKTEPDQEHPDSGDFHQAGCRAGLTMPLSARLKRRKSVGSVKSTSLEGKWILSPKIDWRVALARLGILVAT